MYNENLGRRARYIQRTIVSFWNKIKNSYLAELREHHMHQNKGIKVNDVGDLLKVGDVVVLKELLELIHWCQVVTTTF